MTEEQIAEKIIRDILELIPTTYKNGVCKFVSFKGKHENIGVIIKRYAIEHNISPFNRKKDNSSSKYY